ncbi:hypothetical protein JKA74_16675 [Marivirga sp. S37H4]|uniref:Adenylosuccinate lyase n=1 Tax=Marivirga aurantiaca TaxID=2802615 RepID=A0A935CBB0_9BACT|nr:hypothetical protein [Marivirga aurantiaca]MBK6266682.1 hypothetical protein [Marivirga aurantiaca]
MTDLSKILLSADTFSKQEAEKVAERILRDEGHLDELLSIFIKENIRLTQRAALVLCYFAEQKPDLLIPYLKYMLENLYKNPTDAVKRNTLRILQFVALPTKYHEMAIDKCFQYLENKKEAIAIQVFAMTVLSNIVSDYPELKRELKMLLENRILHGSAGFQSRGKKILKKLNRC